MSDPGTVAIPINNGCFYVMSTAEYVRYWKEHDENNTIEPGVPYGLRLKALRRGKGYKRTKEAMERRGQTAKANRVY